MIFNVQPSPSVVWKMIGNLAKEMEGTEDRRKVHVANQKALVAEFCFDACVWDMCHIKHHRNIERFPRGNEALPIRNPEACSLRRATEQRVAWADQSYSSLTLIVQAYGILDSERRHLRLHFTIHTIAAART